MKNNQLNVLGDDLGVSSLETQSPRRMKASVEVELVGPATAQHWLDLLMEGQRHVRESHVERLVTDMLNGAWHLSPDCITFVKGRLANGQHRLHAVIRAKEPAPFLVLRSNDDELYKVIDDGIKRTVGDTIGGHWAGAIAAAARYVLRYRGGLMTLRGGVSHLGDFTRSDLVNFINDHRPVLQKICQDLCMTQKKNPILSIGLCSGFVALAELEVGNGKEAMKFVKVVLTGDSMNDVSKDLYRRFIQDRLSRTGKLHQNYKLALLIKGFRSHLNGTRPGVLKMVEGEAFPAMPK